MGSEMCIRDREYTESFPNGVPHLLLEIETNHFADTYSEGNADLLPHILDYEAPGGASFFLLYCMP